MFRISMKKHALPFFLCGRYFASFSSSLQHTLPTYRKVAENPWFVGWSPNLLYLRRESLFFRSGPSSRFTHRQWKRKSEKIVDFPVFFDKTLLPPEPRVSAYHKACKYDLIGLQDSFKARGCELYLKDNFLMVETSTFFSQHSCTAVFFKNGCVIFWNMLPQTEELFLKCAGPFATGYSPNCIDAAYVGESEHFDVYDTERLSFIDDSGLYLTKGRARAADKISLSLALMSAVRLNFLEKKIEFQVQAERQLIELLKEEIKSSKLDWMGKKLFESMTMLHRLRYELNIEQDLHSIPDILWEFEAQSHLFLRLQKEFDVRQRIELLNARLSWIFEFLDTFSSYVEKKHASKLEKIIILLIFMELVLGLSQAFREHHHHHH